MEGGGGFRSPVKPGSGASEEREEELVVVAVVEGAGERLGGFTVTTSPPSPSSAKSCYSLQCSGVFFFFLLHPRQHRILTTHFVQRARLCSSFDMWLSSHCNFPPCRAPVLIGVVQNDSQVGSVYGGGGGGGGDDHGVLEIVIGAPSSEIGDDFGGSVVSETSLSLFLGLFWLKMVEEDEDSSSS